MSDFILFLCRLAEHLDVEINHIKSVSLKNEYELAANILHEINCFLYQQTVELEKEYISEFHKYWKENHEQILTPSLGDIEAMKVAEIFEKIYSQNDIRVNHNTLNLDNEAIANVRFFTAIQDFKIDIGANINPFSLYVSNPNLFDAAKIVENELLIDKFLNAISADSQRDKRKKWMLNAAELLNSQYSGSAYNINASHDGDVVKIKEPFVSSENYGFSNKKMDMFLRDMADLNVWEYRKNIDKINVMSDKNTMRIALRTGILKFRIPLLASYLDVYCYQYGLVDNWGVKAWRNVWNKWKLIPNNRCPQTPASMDFFIYRMGKKACWKSPSRRRCLPNKQVAPKWLDALNTQDRLLFEDGYCVFNSICKHNDRILNHPMSISIQGQTGWNSGKINSGGGGGIQS